MNNLNLSRPAAIAACLTLSALGAQAQVDVDVIFCKIPTSPKSIVPGALDLAGNPAVTNYRALEDLSVSEDGSIWIVKARTQQGPDLETILTRGSDLGTPVGFAQEGQPIPTGATGELYDFFGSAAGRFNSLNQFGYAARARGGVAAVFQKVLLWDGATTSIQMQMGDLYTGLMDLAPNPSGDETIGNSIGSIHVLDDGRIGSQDSTIGSIHTSRRPAIFYDNAAFQQTGVTTVVPLAGGTPQLWTTISANTFYTSFDGTDWVAAGTIAGHTTTTDNVLVYNGNAVLQEGSLVPGSSLLMGAVLDSNVTGQGTWYARGRDNSGTTAPAPDWFVRQNVLIAKTGDAITGSENYGDSFLAVATNNNGDWAIACNTNSANPAANEVLVFNGSILLREGDPVDVNGNGLFDDGAFIGRGTNTLTAFGADKLRLTDDGEIYVILHLNDGAGADLNSSPVFGTPDAFIRIDTTVGPVAYCTAKLNSQNCLPAIGFTGTMSATATSGFVLSSTLQLNNKVGLVLYSEFGRDASPFGTGGILCVKAPTRRSKGFSSGGTPPPTADCSGVFSIDFNTFGRGLLGTPPNPATYLSLPGQVVTAQFWGRDPGIPVPDNFSLSNALEFTVGP